MESTTSKSIMETIKKLCLDLLRCLIIQVHWMFDCMVDFVFGLYYDQKAKKVPPVKNPLLLASAVSLAEKIRTKEVTAEVVVQCFIDRCKEVNGLINAIVEERYENAIKDARNVDSVIQRSTDLNSLKKTKPFFGVPFVTKESIEAQGLLHTMGLLSRRHHRSENDATVIAYLKEAGGILIAKTNVPELNLWMESRNNLYGQTCNPYNTTRTVGGSSGGDCSIVSACGAPISVSSDIGGSIRLPAFFNGVFGYKPSVGLTPVKGIGFRQEDYMNSMVTAGPVCKRTEDLAPLFKVLIGDKISKIKLDEPVDLKVLNIFYQESSGDLRASKVNKAMHDTLMKAVQYFKTITGSATKIKLPGSEYSFKIWRYWMTLEGVNFKYNITNKKYNTSANAEIRKLFMGTSEITLAAILKLVEDDYLPKENPEWAQNITTNMKKYLLDKLGDNGVLLYPSFPSSAMYHYSCFLKPYNFSYFCLFNSLRLPTCQIPLGLDENGLPLGIQVVAAPYNDHLCLAVARELEQVFGGWIPPS